MKDLTGTTLKKQYFLRELAGRGGMADVYRAWDNLRASQMAVKVLRRDQPEYKAAFQNEAQRLKELNHPHIVRLYEFERERDIFFIVMDWVDGGNLRQRLDALDRPSSLAEVSQVLEPICSALNFAHHNSTPVFHCDIKPSNIMLPRNGRGVFLTDFGVARLAFEEGGSGTPPYMAPEQFSQKVSAQSDIYGLGVIVYEMLSGGRLPFRADTGSPGSTTRAKYEWEHKNLELPPLGPFNPSLSPAIIEVVKTALQKEPRRRYSSALAFWKAFENASRGKPEPRRPRGNDDQTIFTPHPTPEPLRKPPPPLPPVPVPGPAAVRLGVPHLYVRSGEMAGQSFVIPKAGLKIGRSRECQIRLQDRNISRNHATVFITKRGGFVRDESSTQGTFLNGRRLPPESPLPLDEGDVIQAGPHQFFQFFLK